MKYIIFCGWYDYTHKRILSLDKSLELIREFGNDANCKVNIDNKALVFYIVVSNG